MGGWKRAALSWILLTALVLLPQIDVLAAPLDNEKPVRTADMDDENTIPGTTADERSEEPVTGRLDTSQNAEGTVFEQTLSADYYLNGLFDRCSVYFNVGEWSVESAAFVMYFSSSQLLEQEVSYFTVYVNQMPVSTQYLEQTREGGGTVTIDIPAEAVRPGETNSLTIDVYLRGKDTGACIDDSSVSCWMNIFKESYVTIGYKALNQAETIARFYSKFISIEAAAAGQSAVLVPKGAGEPVLTAMAGIVSGISGNAALNYDKIRCGMAAGEEEIKEYPYVIYICEYDRLPASLKNRMNSRQKQMAESKAAACVLSVQEEGKLLLITGKDEASIANAGKLFANAAYVEQLKTDTVQIDSQKNYLSEEHSVSDYVALTGSGVQVNGIFRQEASFHIDYPANRRLAVSSQLSLDYRYSSNLDFEKSLLTVYVNDTPAGSRRLTKEGAEGTTALFDLPQELEIKGGFTVKVVFDLQPEAEWCRLTPEETPWGYIMETSMLKLAFVDNTELSFSSFPSPFIRDGHMNQVRIILPKEPGNADISAMGSLLLTMGRYLKDNTGSLEVKKGLDAAEAGQFNLISIGKAADNELLRQNTEKLVFQYDENGVLTEGNRPIEADFAAQAGTAELIGSPYGETFHGILLLSGNDDAGLSAALTYLKDVNELWKVSGNAYLTDGETLLESRDRERKEVELPVEQNEIPEKAKPVILMAASVLLLAVLAGVMLLINYRKEGKDE